jgi:hypothetical protein
VTVLEKYNLGTAMAQSRAIRVSHPKREDVHQDDDPKKNSQNVTFGEVTFLRVPEV